ncbi:MAG: hypothetical protein HRT34_06620 [Alcanivorax sp.]|nr:hypothetical protein [Alcanivorax sp.]
MNHAAMCIYCGDTVIYDTREVSDMEAAHRALMEHDQACAKNPLAQRVATLEREVRLARDGVAAAEDGVRAAQTDYYEARRRAVALREALEDVLGWQSLAPAGVLDRARAVLTQEEGG